MDKSSDEIDIQDLAVRLIRFLRKNLIFITISCFLGIGLGYTGYKTFPDVYESKMILMSDILTESYSERLTESLDNLISEGNLKLLASRLQIPEAEAAKIKQVEIESVIDRKEKADADEDATIFIVTVNTLEKEILPQLQSGIIEFLRNNDFVKVRVRQRKELYQAMVDNIGKELGSLDSLKKRIVLGKPAGSGNAETMLVEPSEISTKIIDLKKLQIDYRNALELVNSIQLVEGFTTFEKPKDPKLANLLIAGFVLGFVLSLVILVFRQLLKLAS